VPSLSSASTTNQSPSSHTALVPMSLRSPPMMKLGLSPAATRMRASIDDVVVLPCVPATAMVRRRAAMLASTRPGSTPGCRGEPPRSPRRWKPGWPRDGNARRRRRWRRHGRGDRKPEVLSRVNVGERLMFAPGDVMAHRGRTWRWRSYLRLRRLPHGCGGRMRSITSPRHHFSTPTTPPAGCVALPEPAAPLFIYGPAWGVVKEHPTRLPSLSPEQSDRSSTTARRLTRGRRRF